MAEQKHVARRQSPSKRPRQRRSAGEAAEKSRAKAGAIDEQELADFLQDRIKPGLNSGSIPMLARSIAKEIAERAARNGASGDEPDEEQGLETTLRKVQADLGSDWILYYSVQGEDTWLTAEKEDASQRIEAPSAAVLTRAIKILNKGGGRGR